MTAITYSAVLGVCLLALLVRCAISLHGYSGAGQPPMYGDYEAQRHWMEITFNLPISEWYHNTTNNDLMYWGLDYPPLTAYHSWLCGYAANLFNTSWVKLFQSRGIETQEHKFFMRLTVLFADVLVFFPAVFVYFTKCSLNYKQMELYHAVPFFCYLLGSCFYGRGFPMWKLVKLGLVTILTFALCWLPFLQSTQSAKQVLHRLFPFARGLYEDKVASLWCTLSLVIKFKEILSSDSLVKLCLFTTSIALLPSSLHLLFKPTKRNLSISLVNVSLVFFLFSFQVHEKSILIPAISVCALLPYYPFACMWFLIISVFSMVPLLARDGLLLPTIATSVMFFLATCSLSECHKPATPDRKPSRQSVTQRQFSFVFWPEDIVVVSVFLLSMIGIFVLGLFHLRMKPPSDLPHIYPALIGAYSCAHFVMFLMFFHWKQFFSQEDIAPSKPTRSSQYSTIHHNMKKHN
ncbi:hypothetical protein LSH36_52g03009 [Paralvinella palmiformis]|uniref:Alpha-1,3-glucosyltransferase n=1 Tax=Paralvinella palmiformis TaxID=53620 RepID=A0AAD9K5J3_9ANNE|nr:hypothetical protein LSH36_52g03009 [Paralvinella palmiformis]